MKWHNIDDSIKGAVVVVTLFVALLVSGIIWRTTHGQPAIPDNTETHQERQSRLDTCANEATAIPLHSQEDHPEYRGVCSGFTDEEIKSAKD